MSKTFKIVGNDISDGYHTFDELYEHRIMLYIALASCLPNAAFYTEPKQGWFVLFLELSSGQISYHLPERFIESVSQFALKDDKHDWDGHTSTQTLNRLAEWIDAT